MKTLNELVVEVCANDNKELCYCYRDHTPNACGLSSIIRDIACGIHLTPITHFGNFPDLTEQVIKTMMSEAAHGDSH